MRTADRLVLAIWFGISALASVLLGVSFLVPLSPAAGCGIALTLAALAVARIPRSAPYLPLLRQAVPFIGLALAVAYSASGPVDVYDTGLYHYQLTRWLAEWGTVPGLGLLHVRLGQSSAWFALAAPLDFGPFRARLATLTDSLAFLLGLLHWLIAMERIMRRQSNQADWFLAGGYPLILLSAFTWSFHASLSPDLPLWILILLTGWLLIALPQPAASAILFLAASACAMKLSALPALAVAAMFVIARRNRRPIRLITAIIPAIIVLAANVITTGYPLFPNSLISLSLPWTVSLSTTRRYAGEIVNFARWGSLVPPSPDAVWLLSPWIWRPDKIAVLAICLLCLGLFAMLRGWTLPSSPWILAIAAGGGLFVFATIPNPRFAIGYCALFPALLAAALGARAAGPPRISMHILTGVLTALLIAVTLARDVHSQLLIPPALPQSANDPILIRNRRIHTIERLQLRTSERNGIHYRRPLTNDQCWAVPIPCTPHELHPAIRMLDPQRGPGAGFGLSAAQEQGRYAPPP